MKRIMSLALVALCMQSAVHAFSSSSFSGEIEITIPMPARLRDKIHQVEIDYAEYKKASDKALLYKLTKETLALGSCGLAFYGLFNNENQATLAALTGAGLSRLMEIIEIFWMANMELPKAKVQKAIDELLACCKTETEREFARDALYAKGISFYKKEVYKFV